MLVLLSICETKANSALSVGTQRPLTSNRTASIQKKSGDVSDLRRASSLFSNSIEAFYREWKHARLESLTRHQVDEAHTRLMNEGFLWELKDLAEVQIQPTRCEVATSSYILTPNAYTRLMQLNFLLPGLIGY